MMAAAYRLDMIFACFHEIHKRIEEKKTKLKEFPKQFNIQRATRFAGKCDCEHFDFDDNLSALESDVNKVITKIIKSLTFSHKCVDLMNFISIKSNEEKIEILSFWMDHQMRFDSHFRMKWKVNASKISSS